MVPEDLDFVTRVIAAGLLHDPVLEFGVAYEGPDCSELIKPLGFKYYGTDIQHGPRVDVVANFERSEDLVRFDKIAPFGSIVMLNVLEHTFDPIRILDHAIALVRPGGALVVAAPAVWPLHDYPFDAWRLLPNFYEQFAVRRGLKISAEHFEYVGKGPIDLHRNPDGSYRLPRPTAFEPSF